MGCKISSRTAFESSLRLPVSIGAFVKTIANDRPNAQCRPVAHSMRPNFSNISRFQSIAVVQPRAKGLYEHFLVSERLFGTFLKPWNHQFSIHASMHTCIHASMHTLGYASPCVYIDLVYIMLWVVGGNCPYKCLCNRIRGERTRGKRFTAN